MQIIKDDAPCCIIWALPFLMGGDQGLSADSVFFKSVKSPAPPTTTLALAGSARVVPEAEAGVCIVMNPSETIEL
jgi:hypothetical protein